MPRTEELKLIITGDGRIIGNVLRQTERQIGGFTGRAGKLFSQMHTRMNEGIKRFIGSPFTALASTAGVMALGKQVVEFDASLVRLQNTGRLTSEEMVGLRQSLVDDAVAVGQSRESLVAGISTIVDKTGNIKFAVKNIKDIGIAATATGASVEDMAALASNLNEKMSIDNLMDAFNLISAQGKAGAFTLRDMAALGERLFSSAGRLGTKGQDDLKKFGALIQVAQMGTGSSEQATTAIERIISNVIAKQDQIRKTLGFDIFSDRTTQKYKSIDEIIKGIIRSAKGNEKVLGDVFGEEGIRGVTTLAKMYRETNGFDLFDKLMNADAGHTGEILDDFSRLATTASFHLAQLAEVGKKFADSALYKPIADLNDAIKDLVAHPERLKTLEGDFRSIGELLSFLAKVTFSVVKGWGLIYGGLKDGPFSDKHKLITAAGKEFKALSKDEQKRLKPMISGASWDTSIYSIMENYKAGKYDSGKNAVKIENNITINQAADGHVVGVKSDSLNTENNVSFNRGIHTARQ